MENVPLRPETALPEPERAQKPVAGVLTRSKFRLNWIFYALIAVGCVLRLTETFRHNPLDHLWSDPMRHWEHASKPLEPSPMSLFDPPIYQIWLSIVQRVTMGIPALVAAVVGALSVIGPWCWYRFLRETIASRTFALAGWSVLALLPSWIGIYSYFMTETLLIPMIGLSLWMTQRARRRMTISTFIAMVVVWMLTGLTRGITIPLAGVACLLVWVAHPKKIRTAFYSIIILGATLVPLSIRNYHFVYLWPPYGNGWIAKIYGESGKREILLHFERQGARWVYGFTSPMVDERPFDFTQDWKNTFLSSFGECPDFLKSDWKSSREGTVTVSIDFTKGTRDWKNCLDKNALHGAARRKMHLENIAFLFFGNSWPDNDNSVFICRMSNLSRWLWLPFFVVTAAIGIARWRILLCRPLLPLLIATWLFFQVGMLVSGSEGRYRKPLEGLLIAQAVILAATLYEKRKSEERQLGALDTR